MIQYVPFAPDPFQEDWSSWTHRAVALPSDDIVSIGPLGTFTFPGASYPHVKSIPSATSGDGPPYVPFVTATGVQVDLMALPWFTATPWEAPSFPGVHLRACPSPCNGFQAMSTFGDAFAIVRPASVPEPEAMIPMLISAVGIVLVGVRLRPLR